MGNTNQRRRREEGGLFMIKRKCGGREEGNARGAVSIRQLQQRNNKGHRGRQGKKSTRGQEEGAGGSKRPVLNNKGGGEVSPRSASAEREQLNREKHMEERAQ